jgi:hypothetical protein
LPKGRGQPRSSDLDRAFSTAYYAVFHAFAYRLVESLLGKPPNADIGLDRWISVYRSIGHKELADVLAEGIRGGAMRFGPSLARATPEFRKLQRHEAD